MDRHDLKRAAAANSALENAERDLEALVSDDFKVTSIQIDRGEGILNPITLAKGRCGTGSISGIGYSDELQAAMTKALYDYFHARVAAAKATLAEMGIAE